MNASIRNWLGSLEPPALHKRYCERKARTHPALAPALRLNNPAFGACKSFATPGRDENNRFAPDTEPDPLRCALADASDLGRPEPRTHVKSPLPKFIAHAF